MKLSHFVIRTKTSRKTLETLEQQLWVHFQREGYGACGFGVLCGVRSSVVYRGQLHSYSLGHNELVPPARRPRGSSSAQIAGRDDSMAVHKDAPAVPSPLD